MDDLKATAGPASVLLKWTPPEGCTEITLYYKRTSSGSLNPVPGANISSAMNSFTVANLEPGILYVFFLEVIGGENQGRSNEVSATPLADEPTPTPTTAPAPTTTPGPSVVPSVTAAPSLTITPSGGAGASGGGGCNAEGVSISIVLLLLPLLLKIRN